MEQESVSLYRAPVVEKLPPIAPSVTRQHERWFSRRGLAAVTILTAAALAGCSSSGGGSAPATPATTTASADAISVTSYFAADDCLEYLAQDENTENTIAVKSTNLCRAEVSSFPYGAEVTAGTYYEFYVRGTSTSVNWDEIAGKGNDGYYYWEYPDQIMYREPVEGGDTQVLVQYTDGTYGYEDQATLLQQNPVAISFLDKVKEGLSQLTLDKAAVATATPTQKNPTLSSGDSSGYQTAQTSISAKDQVTQQEAEQAQQAQQEAQAAQNAQSEAAKAQAAADLAQAQNNMDRIWFSPDCTDSDNVEAGCGGANAFNDDGGVGFLSVT
jgi:hypothetical protein